jgi:hypothetical protein
MAKRTAQGPIRIPEDNVIRYFNFINERHMIYIKKSQGLPRPWTDDPVLREYKFTNIFRELDRGTEWYRVNIRVPYADDPYLFFNTCVYRHFNYFPTAIRIGYIRNFDPASLEKLLREVREDNGKVYTSAHMTTGTLGGDKITQSVWKVLKPLWYAQGKVCPKPSDTLKSAFEKFLAPGFGPFTRYEVITDLRHTRYLQHATDIMTWANAGPGAMRGCDRICGSWTTDQRWNNNYTPEQYISIMRHLLEASPKYLGSHVPAMEMRDIEHSLCEFDKYERGRLGQGKLRAHYVPFEERKRI